MKLTCYSFLLSLFDFFFFFFFFFFYVEQVKGMTSDATIATTNVTQDVAQAKISTGRPWADASIKVHVIFFFFFLIHISH